MYTKPENLYERLSSARMSSTARRAAVAHLRSSEVSVDLIIRAADTFRRTVARLRRMLGLELRLAASKELENRGRDLSSVLTAKR